jgi:Holliday junction DNA helicase RuvA
MISRIKGRLTDIEEDTVTVEVSNLYYEILIPSALREQFKFDGSIGQEIELYTFYYIESSGGMGNQFPRLVGFSNPNDRGFFQLLTTVHGLGVRKALKSLTLPIRELAYAIETGDKAELLKLPGIGSRMSEKIIAELKGKTYLYALIKEGEALSLRKEAEVDFKEEVLKALMQLQYKRGEAERIIDKALSTGKKFKSPEEMLQTIFQQQL